MSISEVSWRGNGKSGEVSSPSVARRSLVHGGVTGTTVIFCFPSSENPCPSSKRMCPALIPFGLFCTVSWDGAMFVFPVPLNRPPEERKGRSCVSAPQAGPGRAGPSRVGPRPRPGVLAPGGIRSRAQSSHSSQAGGSLPPKIPSRGSFPARVPGGASQGAGAAPSPPRLEPFLPFNPALRAGSARWPVARLLLRERGGGKKAIDFNRISPQTLLVCCCYASIWRSLFINERVRSVAKTLRARICVIKLRAGWGNLAGDEGGGRWASGTCSPAFLWATLAPQASFPRREADFLSPQPSERNAGRFPPCTWCPAKSEERWEHFPGAAAAAGAVGHCSPYLLCSPTFVKPLRGTVNMSLNARIVYFSIESGSFAKTCTV